MGQALSQLNLLKPNFEPEKKIELKLTKREKEVLEYVCSGNTNKEIAKILSLSLKTIEGYKTKLLSKTKTRNSAHLVMFAAVNGLIKV